LKRGSAGEIAGREGCKGAESGLTAMRKRRRSDFEKQAKAMFTELRERLELARDAWAEAR
jgi:hypothetical protein